MRKNLLQYKAFCAEDMERDSTDQPLPPQLLHKAVYASPSYILPNSFLQSFNCYVLRNVGSDNLVVTSALGWLICATVE